MPVFSKFNISGLTVFVGGIIRNIYFLPVVPVFVPIILEIDTVIPSDLAQKIRNFRVAVYPHPFRKQGMVIGIVRIVLGCVVLCYDGISCQVQEKAAVFPNDLANPFFQLIMLYHFPDHKPCPDLQAATAYVSWKLVRHILIREIFQVIPVRYHHVRVIVTLFPDRGTLWYSIFFIRIILSSILVINIGGAFDFLLRYPRLLIRKFDFEIQIHMAS